MKNKFNHIENVSLRTWNRCTIYYNLMVDVSKEAANNYFKDFDDISKGHMKKMFHKIRDDGISNVKRKVINGGCLLGEC